MQQDTTKEKHLKKKKGSRTWAEAAKIVLELNPKIPMGHKEILRVIKQRNLKEISGSAPLACLNAMLHAHSRGNNALFYKVAGRMGVYGLKSLIPEGATLLEMEEEFGIDVTLDEDGEPVESLAPKSANKDRKREKVLYVKLPHGYKTVPAESNAIALPNNGAVSESVITSSQELPAPTPQVEVRDSKNRTSSLNVVPPITLSLSKGFHNSAQPCASILSSSTISSSPAKVSQTHSKRAIKHALKQQQKRRRKNTEIAARGTTTGLIPRIIMKPLLPPPPPAPCPQPATAGVADASPSCKPAQTSLTSSAFTRSQLSLTISSTSSSTRTPSQREHVKLYSSTLAAKTRKRSLRKLSSNSGPVEMQYPRSGSIDMETPQSILVNTNLRELLSKQALASLPPACQHRLVQLLPEVDRAVGADNAPRLSSSAALNNEFFAKACQQWRARLAQGEFVPENQVKLKAELEKDQGRVDPWKVKHFEPIWGQKVVRHRGSRELAEPSVPPPKSTKLSPSTAKVAAVATVSAVATRSSVISLPNRTPRVVVPLLKLRNLSRQCMDNATKEILDQQNKRAAPTVSSSDDAAAESASKRLKTSRSEVKDGLLLEAAEAASDLGNVVASVAEPKTPEPESVIHLPVLGNSPSEVETSECTTQCDEVCQPAHDWAAPERVPLPQTSRTPPPLSPPRPPPLPSPVQPPPPPSPSTVEVTGGIDNDMTEQRLAKLKVEDLVAGTDTTSAPYEVVHSSSALSLPDSCALPPAVIPAATTLCNNGKMTSIVEVVPEAPTLLPPNWTQPVPPPPPLLPAVTLASSIRLPRVSGSCIVVGSVPSHQVVPPMRILSTSAGRSYASGKRNADGVNLERSYQIIQEVLRSSHNREELNSKFRLTSPVTKASAALTAGAVSAAANGANNPLNVSCGHAGQSLSVVRQPASSIASLRVGQVSVPLPTTVNRTHATTAVPIVTSAAAWPPSCSATGDARRQNGGLLSRPSVISLPAGLAAVPTPTTTGTSEGGPTLLLPTGAVRRLSYAAVPIVAFTSLPSSHTNAAAAATTFCRTSATVTSPVALPRFVLSGAVHPSATNSRLLQSVRFQNAAAVDDAIRRQGIAAAPQVNDAGRAWPHPSSVITSSPPTVNLPTFVPVLPLGSRPVQVHSASRPVDVHASSSGPDFGGMGLWHLASAPERPAGLPVDKGTARHVTAPLPDAPGLLFSKRGDGGPLAPPLPSENAKTILVVGPGRDKGETNYGGGNSTRPTSCSSSTSVSSLGSLDSLASGCSQGLPGLTSGQPPQQQVSQYVLSLQDGGGEHFLMVPPPPPPRASSAPPQATAAACTDAQGFLVRSSSLTGELLSLALKPQQAPPPEPSSAGRFVVRDDAAKPGLPAGGDGRLLPHRGGLEVLFSGLSHLAPASSAPVRHRAPNGTYGAVAANFFLPVSVAAAPPPTSVNVLPLVSVAGAVSMRQPNVVVGHPVLASRAGVIATAANQPNCVCNLKAMIACKKCGAFCHDDCIGPLRLCVTCLIR